MTTREISKKSTIKGSTSRPNPNPKITSRRNPNPNSNPKPKSKPLTTKPRKKKDYISQLPDHILHIILSFLSLKQRARTTILSHRWRNVWASMLKFDFYKDQFAKMGQNKFITIANSAIPYRPKEDFQNFKTFLIGDSSSNLAKSSRWINFAVKNEVKTLYIIIKLNKEGGNVILPRSVLTCESLKELCLFCYPNVKIITPRFINMNGLKSLSLQRMEINSVFLGKIILGCLNLQNLNLHFCELSFSGISSKSLRNLVMENCWIKIKGGNNNNNNKFFICAPNLLFLQFNQELRDLLRLEKIEKMFKLEIPNLKHLTLGGSWISSYSNAVPFFLKNSPKLEKLTLLCEQGFRSLVENVLELNDLSFNCADLKLVEIVCNRSNESIEKIRNILEQNGILDAELNMDGSYNEGDLLKELYDVWVWINDQLVDKTRVHRNFVV
ncbi:hypothetical protein LUZ60_005486 [Juncus effusus]|nr:hypothetical protein LUZ60_005486 [Juncus effusus]